MLSVDRALEIILSHIPVMNTEERPLIDCLGQVLAEDISAGINVPNVPCSMMDGYAVRCEDIRDARPDHPVLLRVIDTIGAGSVSRHKVASGAAIRIMTGAPIPDGSDCVVRFEDTASDQELATKKIPDKVCILSPSKPGMNIRQAGESITKGATVLNNGKTLGPAELNIGASLGYERLKVVRRPVISIICSGEELVAQGKSLGTGQIYSGNMYSLASQVILCGGIPRLSGIAHDNTSSLSAKIRESLASDAIISAGGVSMGDFDLTRDVLSAMGEIVFWRVDMSPGNPFAFALIKKNESSGKTSLIPHFALTGSTSGGMVNFEVLVRPAILSMLGKTGIQPHYVESLLEEPVENKKHARNYIWASVSQNNSVYHARISRNHRGGIIPSIAGSNALLIIPENITKLEQGEKVQTLLLDWHQP
jgi:molybdopterin molybdotransferase